MKATRSGSLYQPRSGHKPGWVKGQPYSSHKSHVTEHLRWNQQQQFVNQGLQGSWEDVMFWMMAKNGGLVKETMGNTVDQGGPKQGPGPGVFNGFEPAYAYNRKVRAQGVQRDGRYLALYKSHTDPKDSLFASESKIDQASQWFQTQAQTPRQGDTSERGFNFQNYLVQNLEPAIQDNVLIKNYFDKEPEFVGGAGSKIQESLFKKTITGSIALFIGMSALLYPSSPVFAFNGYLASGDFMNAPHIAALDIVQDKDEEIDKYYTDTRLQRVRSKHTIFMRRNWTPRSSENLSQGKITKDLTQVGDMFPSDESPIPELATAAIDDKSLRLLMMAAPPGLITGFYLFNKQINKMISNFVWFGQTS